MNHIAKNAKTNSLAQSRAAFVKCKHKKCENELLSPISAPATRGKCEQEKCENELGTAVWASLADRSYWRTVISCGADTATRSGL
jgi:hypothetical protein